MLRVLRLGTGVLLGGSGALMYAASWQRWASVCTWGDVDSWLCATRQDHLYDFVLPASPWEPVGDAAQLAGWSLLVLALAGVLLPWALMGRRPGVVSASAWVGVVLALGWIGFATLRSGLSGNVVATISDDLVLLVWVFLPPGLLVRFAVAARGWSLAATVCLLLATPLVAEFSYGLGSHDTQPWTEAISGLLTITAGLCLLGAATFGARSQTTESPAKVASPALPVGAVPPS